MVGRNWLNYCNHHRVEVLRSILTQSSQYIVCVQWSGRRWAIESPIRRVALTERDLIIIIIIVDSKQCTIPGQQTITDQSLRSKSPRESSASRFNACINSWQTTTIVGRALAEDCRKATQKATTPGQHRPRHWTENWFNHIYIPFPPGQTGAVSVRVSYLRSVQVRSAPRNSR